MKTTIIFSFIFLIYFLYNKKFINNKIHPISIDSSNCLKGAMAIAVVLHHLSQRTDIYIYDFLFEDFGGIAVGCFFFISGYGLISSYEAKGKTYLTGFLLKRWRKLIVPFLFVIILFQLINSKIPDILNCFATGIVDDILPFSWYVFCAILFYFAFYFTFKYAKNEIRGIVQLFIFTCFLYVILRFVVHYPAYWWGSLSLFSIGIIIKSIEKYSIYKKFFLYIFLSIVLLVVFLFIANKYISFFQNYKTTFVLSTLAPLIYVLLLMIIDISFKPLQWLGKISYEIYLVQGIAFYIVRKYINDDILFSSLSLVFTIVLAYIIKIILNKLDAFMCKIFK